MIAPPQQRALLQQASRILNRQTKKASDARFANKAEKLKLQIDQLTRGLYNLNSPDPRLRYANLKTFRTEIQRGFIINLHLAIEDLLKALLFYFFVKQNKRLTTRDTKKIVDDMKSLELIQWCARLNLISPKQYNHLKELNRVRNVCSHNWVLDIPKFRRVKNRNLTKRMRVHVVTYKGRNLLASEIFSNEFLPVYGPIYLKLLGRVWKLKGLL